MTCPHQYSRQLLTQGHGPRKPVINAGSVLVDSWQPESLTIFFSYTHWELCWCCFNSFNCTRKNYHTHLTLHPHPFPLPKISNSKNDITDTASTHTHTHKFTLHIWKRSPCKINSIKKFILTKNVRSVIIYIYINWSQLKFKLARNTRRCHNVALKACITEWCHYWFYETGNSCLCI